MNDVAVLMADARFRKVVAGALVGLNLLESAHGNAFNDGIRFAAKWIFDNIMLNADVEAAQKAAFMEELGEIYVKDKTGDGDGRDNA